MVTFSDEQFSSINILMTGACKKPLLAVNNFITYFSVCNFVHCPYTGLCSFMRKFGLNITKTSEKNRAGWEEKRQMRRKKVDEKKKVAWEEQSLMRRTLLDVKNVVWWEELSAMRGKEGNGKKVVGWE